MKPLLCVLLFMITTHAMATEVPSLLDTRHYHLVTERTPEEAPFLAKPSTKPMVLAAVGIAGGTLHTMAGVGMFIAGELLQNGSRSFVAVWVAPFISALGFVTLVAGAVFTLVFVIKFFVQRKLYIEEKSRVNQASATLVQVATF